MSLLVSKINQLGDSISFLPVVKELADLIYPDRLTVLCTSFGQAVFAGASSNIDFVVFDRTKLKSTKSLIAFGELWKRNRHDRHTKALYSYNEPSIAYGFSKILGIEKRIGFASGIARGQSFLTETLPFDPAREVVQSEFDLVRHTADNWSLAPRRIPIAYSDHEKQAVVTRLHQAIGDAARPFVIIHPEASLQYKMWGEQNYLDLAARIENELGKRVIFVTHRERHFPGFNSLANMTVKELACLFESAKLFIGNNSGPMHIADAMGTTILSIRGPSPARWDPIWTAGRSRALAATHLACVPCERYDYQPKTCLNNDYPMGCMQEISVQRVLTEAQILLNSEPRSSPGQSI